LHLPTTSIRGLDRAILRDENRLDYFDGEEPDEPTT